MLYAITLLRHIKMANALLMAERKKRIGAAASADFASLLEGLAIQTGHEAGHRALGPLLVL